MAVDPNALPPAPPSEGNFFTRKLGPLPVWGWAVVVVAGVGLGWWFLRNQSNSDSGTTQDNGSGGTAPAANGTGYSAGGPYAGYSGLDTGNGYDPLANTNALLQEIIDRQNQNINPPTTTGSSQLNGYTKQHIATGNETLAQIASQSGTSASSLVYNPSNTGLKSLLEALHVPFQGQNGYGTYKPKAGTIIYVPQEVNTAGGIVAHAPVQSGAPSPA